MGPTKWTRDDGLKQNEVLDRLLGREMKRRRRATQIRWSAVKPAAGALISFLYDDLADKRRAARALQTVYAYQEPRGEGHAHITLYAKDLSMAQAELRSLVATLVLTFRPGGAPTLSGSMLLDHVRIMGWMVYGRRADGQPIRGGLEVNPPHQYRRVVVAGADVLMEALLWIRFCPVCGALFMKVKGQRCCSPRHTAILEGRSRQRKGDGTETRGRKRTRYEEAIEGSHTEWIEAACSARNRQVQ